MCVGEWLVYVVSVHVTPHLMRGPGKSDAVRHVRTLLFGLDSGSAAGMTRKKKHGRH